MWSVVRGEHGIAGDGRLVGIPKFIPGVKAL